MNTSTLTFKVGKLAFVPTLQERIAEIMSSTGLTVGEIASITGVSSSAVTQWKDGQTKSIKTGPATKLAAHTGYSALWIGEGDGPMRSGPVEVQAGPPTLAQALEVVAASLNQLPDDQRELAAQRLQTLARAPDSARAMESLLAAMRPTPSPPPPESRDFQPPVPSGLFVKHKQPS